MVKPFLLATKDFRRSLSAITVAAVLAITLSSVGIAQDRERIGRVQQGLVGTTLVSAVTREQLGLVTLSTGCSGSAVRDNWIITAAHCIDDPDPANPGRFINVPENSVTITANWGTEQMRTVQRRQSMRIISFRPSDVAIIRIADRFYAPNQGFNRGVFQDAFVPLTITAYGRGINQFAQGSGATAMPSQSDNQYRMANFTTNSEQGRGGDHLVWYPSVNGQMIGGGDSGGPSFRTSPSGDLLFGVHARCNSTCLPGQTCAANDWTWISATPRCADAPVAPLWDDINRYMGAFVPNRPSLVSNDFNNDNLADILWYNSSTGESQIWFMSGSSRIGRATIVDGSRPTLIGPPWRIVGSRDFNRDKKTDFLWHNATTGETQIWYMDGYRFSGRATVFGENGRAAYVNLPFSIVGTNDMNGDQQPDIVWHNSSTGETQIWHMNGSRVIGRATVLGENGSAVFINLPWRIVGTNDFNADGKPDLLWHNGSTGETQIWHMNGYRAIGRATVFGETGRAAYVGLPFRIVGTNDFNQDGTADILWHNGSTGETQMWLMRGSLVIRRATVDADQDGGGSMVGAPWSIMNH